MNLSGLLLVNVCYAHCLHKAPTSTKHSHLFVVSWDSTEKIGVEKLVLQNVRGGCIADLWDLQVGQDTSQVNGTVTGVRPHVQVYLLWIDHL